MEKKINRFLQNQQYTFYGKKKKEKISLIYHQIIPLAIPEIQIVQYSKHQKMCNVEMPKMTRGHNSISIFLEFIQKLIRSSPHHYLPIP